MVEIVLSGYILVPESELKTVCEALPHHIRLTLLEEGCTFFSVVQDADNPLRFNVYEKFTGRESLDLHQKRVRESEWGRVTQNVERFYEVNESQLIHV